MVPARIRGYDLVLISTLALSAARLFGSAISQFKGFGSSSKHAEIGPESFGIVLCRSVGNVPGILHLVWPRFRHDSGSKSKISRRILQSCRGSFSSAEVRFSVHACLRWLCTRLVLGRGLLQVMQFIEIILCGMGSLWYGANMGDPWQALASLDQP